MNKSFIMGRLTRDPELRMTQSQVPVCSFTVAVDRKFKDQSGQPQTDFINVVAWKKTAEFVVKYFFKGSKIIVIGAIQVRNYDDKDGNKRIATEIVADEVEFAESKPSGQQADQQHTTNNGFPPAPDDDTSLPFDL